LGATVPDLVATGIALTGEGSRFTVRWGGDEATVSLPLLGRFNVENALSALGAALLLGVGLADGATRLSSAPAPIGRLEVTVREPVPVILDYAHTPDALRRVLETIRPLYSGRVILVFGAGGDRDRMKRPKMGGVAARGADLAIVTSDNPRTEDPEAIVDDIVAGMRGASYERITDRRDAIARALAVARPGDVVVLAGKGHETYQIVGTERRPFDERTVVREILGSGRAA
jgi:UDP-N-acetylmuramoyl-L-alanyl-D-glutamate--2,6-diaminopimelate ligase